MRTSRNLHGRPKRDDNCGEVAHIQRNCPKLALDTTKHLEESGVQDLELEGLCREENRSRTMSTERDCVDAVTVSTVEEKRSLLCVCVEVKGLPAEAVVDTGAQFNNISSELLS